MRKSTFIILSFTWGLPLTLIGCIVAGVLFVAGYRPKRYGWCMCFEIGENWGGLELGLFFITDKTSGERIKNHEHGHALQNCYFGVIMPFVICIPSAIRYWYRKVISAIKPSVELPPYDSIWFEAQATRWGTDFMNKHKQEGYKWLF